MQFHTAALTAHQITKSYNLSSVLRDVTFSVNPGERVGLIGPNGSGKSTLMRILVGETRPDSGHIAYTPASLRLGYLSQGFEPEPTLQLKQLLHDGESLENELVALGMALAEDPGREDLQQGYDDVLDKLSRLDPGRVHTIMHGLGLAHLPPTQPIGTLSGGQKTRLALARVLLDDPQLLLLDEPTNHLDIAMIEWLENWLSRFGGGALIVSHDRTFLDHTTSKIIDLDPHTHTLREYAGNYSNYLEQHAQEREKQWSAYRDQVYEERRMRQDIARTMEQANSVERNTTPRQPNIRRYAKKVAKKAKSRERKLKRYLGSDERVEKPNQSWQLKLEFETGHIGRDVLRLEGVTVGYPGRGPLLQNLNLTIQSGQRIALTGANGTGKTTLIKAIAGQMETVSGRVHLGNSVKLGYMSQEQSQLDPHQNALTIIQSVAPLNETEARSFLHYFLFTNDDPLRPTAQLSYGERARLALAKLIAEGCTFLLLDEPINHLDIPSRTRFEQALTQFKGTILAVIHDRYFIERFATEIWHVENKAVQRKIHSA